MKKMLHVHQRQRVMDAEAANGQYWDPRSRMAKAHAYVRKNMHSAIDWQRQVYYKDRQTYMPTQPVWLWRPRLRPGQSRKFALYWTGPWQIKRQLNKLMFEITPHHSWARQGSEAVSIDRLKPFHAMYVDALEHYCSPDPKADLKMLGDKFAEFIDTDLEEEINAGPPAQQQLPAGVRQAPPPAAAGAAAAAADPPPFGQLEHAAHPVPLAVFNDEEDAPCAPKTESNGRRSGKWAVLGSAAASPSSPTGTRCCSRGKSPQTKTR
jgi:hypothetical protein